MILLKKEKSREVHDHVKIKAPNGPTSEEDVEEEILSFETDKDALSSHTHPQGSRARVEFDHFHPHKTQRYI